ncbi:type I polyketide synthase [Aquabacterium sp. A7-Y]|uniref:type I polyketide synthase n=1 Tax=Aquabacterium sp. A7-Y TaxID=1349605 RepID=UPI00223CD05D|nr:type I polyketide synthase [Aquabacterium sp. A7-Y]MCW7541032.1 type I polyketide synthase [Aquabacterium sp. A7-Y]
MTREPLAIVGMGCRFPGSSDSPEAYWDMLLKGVDAIRDVPLDRWDVRKFYDPDPQSPGRAYTRQGGFLNESIWDFDPGFFGISAREASIMDPQQRLLLEVTWEAFEDAGLVLDERLRKRVGVYVGAFCFDNAVQQMSQPSRDAIFSHSATSASMVMLSNRLSYVFDLQGPSFTVDTACSSSLVATHLGCQALWNGECDVAVIGGVNVMLRPEMTILECKGGFLSSDARCRTFDASAGGYVRAEGAGVVVVRPLSAALAAGDRIVALIRGTGINQDGRTSGITVPNGEAQEALIAEVCATAGVAPAEIGYVEAHGTGTQVGDPIEAQALGHAIGQRQADGSPVWVGSVKTNMGHLEAAAGVAGLMKTALCLYHQQLPPHLHLQTPNPKIDFDALGLRVPRAVEPLSPQQGRYAAVNSFGYGGTNAHVILERAPDMQALPRPAAAAGPCLVPLSARTDAALAQLAGRVAERLRRQPDLTLPALGHALAVRRAHHDHRAVVIAQDRDELLARLDALGQGGREPALRSGRAPGERKLAWVYTGMGAQWWGMGRSLFSASPVFRDAIAACDAAWQRAGGDGLRALFDPAAGMALPLGEPMPEPRDAQPANLALQVGVTTVLRSLGLEADAIVGHSVGEIGAAWAAGALTLDDAFRLTFHRCRLQQTQLGLGGMLALPMSPAAAREQILALAPEVESRCLQRRRDGHRRGRSKACSASLPGPRHGDSTARLLARRRRLPQPADT